MKPITSLALLGALVAWGVFNTHVALAANCVSIGSGSWSTAGTWTSCGGGTPGSGDNVFIETPHLVTLTQNEAVNDLNLNVTSSSRLSTGAFTLSVNGRMRGYSGTQPGTDSTTEPALTTWIDTTGGGTIKVVGSSRTVWNSGQWSANPPGWRLEVAMTAGQTATAATNVKALDISVSGGTLNMNGNDLRPDGGAASSGTLTVTSGATLDMGAGVLARTGTANTPFASLTLTGTLKTANSSTNVWPSATSCSFASTSSVEYNRAGTQTIQTPSGGAYGNITLSGSSTKTGPSGSIDVKGSWTNSGTTYAPNGGTVNFNGSATQTIGGSSVTAFNIVTVASGATVDVSSTAIPTAATSWTNNGTLLQTQSVPATTTVNFLQITNGGGTDRYRGIDFANASANLGSTSVRVQGNNTTCNNAPNGGSYRNRCMRAATTNSGTADITVYSTVGEDDASNDVIFISNGSATWTALTTNANCNAAAGNSCTSTGVSFSTEYFLIGDGTNTPTAIKLISLTSESGSRWWHPGALWRRLLGWLAFAPE